MAKDTNIKKELKCKGWSYRRAAPLLEVHWEHLYMVANGKRKSHRLELKIQRLPNYSEFVAKFPTYFENKRRRPRKLSTKQN